jgi:DNA repair photolyase
MELIQIRGRGAASNPPNRFERLSFLPDPEARDADDPGPRTQFLRDTSRTIIARNHSPDVGFDFSINPYRGCEHGCVYCLSGDTRILTPDGTTVPLADIRVGDAIYGTARHGRYRYYVRTEVLAHWRTRKPAYRVTLEDGTQLVASGDHRFLTERGWKFVTGAAQGRARRPHLTPQDRLMGIGAQTVRCLGQLGFAGTVEFGKASMGKPLHAVRLSGGLGERMRFFHTVHPAIPRTRQLEGDAVQSNARLGVLAVEPLGDPQTLFDITTGTGDFIANGVISHNCYARPTHEYLGFSAGLDFETRILVKPDAPELLRHELSQRRWKPGPIALSGVTDPYQPVERRLRLTRGCLEVLAEVRNPVSIITKNQLVTRDLDLLGELAPHQAVMVSISVTTLDPELQRVMEPRTSVPARRLAAVEALAGAGIPVGVMVAPIIPGLNDHEIPKILAAAAGAGARFAAFVLLRLPLGIAGLFEEWLELHFPERREKVLGRLREMRGGKLNDPRFGARMRGEGAYAGQIGALFRTMCGRFGLSRDWPALATDAFRRPHAGAQLGLFEGAAEDPGLISPPDSP